MGMLTAVPVSLADIVGDLDFQVVDGYPLEVIIGDPAMEDRQIIIDIGKRTVRLTREGHMGELQNGPDYSWEREYTGGTDSDDLT